MKPIIGRTSTNRTLRTHRTLISAFGPHARLYVPRTRTINWDMVIGAVCVGVVLALPWLTWKGII